MAKRITKVMSKQLTDKLYQQDIKQINNVRKASGFRNVPVRNTTWYDKVLKYSRKKYSNSEYAAKVISISISPYQAKMLQTDRAYVARLDRIVKQQTFNNTSLDVAIQKQNINTYGSDIINKLADRDEALAIEAFKNGKRNWQTFLKQGNIKGI